MTPGHTSDGVRERASQQRLTVATEMDAWSASTRYRALQHVTRLRGLFSEVDVLLPNDPVARPPGRVAQARYFGRHAAQYVREAAVLRSKAAHSDAMLIQRGLYVVGPGTIVASLNRFSGRIVFDLDDAVFRLSPWLARKSAAARWLYGPQQALALMQRADAIVVSTQELADLLPAGLPAPTILPTVPDPGRHRIVEHHDGLPVVVGWAGTLGGVRFLDPLTNVFQRLADQGIATLEVVSSHSWSGPSRFHRWTLDEEIAIFERFSIGIMPLPDTEYTRAKAGFKLLQYMASGIPVVCSPIGVNRELVERSGGGLFAETPDEWENALQTLATDPDLRSSIGARGRAFVVEYADLDAQALTLASLLVGAKAN